MKRFPGVTMPVIKELKSTLRQSWGFPFVFIWQGMVEKSVPTLSASQNIHLVVVITPGVSSLAPDQCPSCTQEAAVLERGTKTTTRALLPRGAAGIALSQSGPA